MVLLFFLEKKKNNRRNEVNLQNVHYINYKIYFMKIYPKIVLCVAVATMVFSSCNAGKEPAGLKDAYKKDFLIGVAVNPRNISTPEQIELIKANFNSITAENVMKPGEMHPAPGVWNLEQADAVADFCRQNNIKLRGHCLVWHSQFANWMFNKYDKDGNQVVKRDEKGDTIFQEQRRGGGRGFGGAPQGQGAPRDNSVQASTPVMVPVYEQATKEEFYDSLRAHIYFVVNRYKDIIYGWDVTNECMSDANNIDASYEDSFRKSQLYNLCGDEFILKAFQFAHEADPKALLFYNDYSAWTPAKRTYIYNMVKKLQAEGAPITGIGMQGHYNIYDNPTVEDFEKAVEMYSELVKVIHITELDVRINHETGGQLQFSRDGQTITDEIIKQQEDKYSELFRSFLKYKKVIKSVTFWNLSDRDSWLGARNYPLPFDENYQPKPLYNLLINKDYLIK